MRRRSAEILQRLLDAPSHTLDASVLLDDYRISEKTLRLDMQAIQSFVRLPDGSDVASMFDGIVRLADGADIPSVQSQLDEMDLYDYQLSTSERRLYIVARLLVTGPLSMKLLADDMYVTRNTVVNDCKAVDKYLSDRGLEFASCGKRGVGLTVGESRKSLIIDVFSEALELRHHSHDFFTRLLVKILDYRVDVDQVIRLGREFFRENSTVISHDAENEIAACLVVLLNETSYEMCSEVQLRDQRDFLDNLILYVSRRINEHAEPDDHLLEQVKEKIIERNLLPQVRKINDFDLYGAITHFLFLVGANLGVELQGDETLVGGLLSHIKSIMDWNSDSFELSVSDPSGYMVSIVRDAAAPHFHVLERYLHRPLDDSMRSSIIIHICAGLYRYESSSRPRSVVITCPASMATGRYLEAQIKSYFNFNIVATLSVYQLDDYLKASDTGVDFVISTVPVELADCPVVVVAPVLTLDDLNRIQAMVFSRRRDVDGVVAESASMMNSLRAAYMTVGTEKRRFLDRSIRGLIEELGNMEERASRSSLLLGLLKPRNIRVENGKLGWRESIRLSAGCLVHDGCVTSDYVERAIKNVEDYGSYIVVNQGIGLAHASHDDGALADGIALLVHPGGIEFDDDVTVHLLFFFSQKSQREYLDLFHEVIRLGNNQDELERICRLGTPELVYQALVELLTDYSSANE